MNTYIHTYAEGVSPLPDYLVDELIKPKSAKSDSKEPSSETAKSTNDDPLAVDDLLYALLSKLQGMQIVTVTDNTDTVSKEEGISGTIRCPLVFALPRCFDPRFRQVDNTSAAWNCLMLYELSCIDCRLNHYRQQSDSDAADADDEIKKKVAESYGKDPQTVKIKVSLE